MKAQKELSNLKDFTPVLKLLVEFGIVRFHCSEEVHVDKYYMIQNIVKYLVKENAAPQPEDFIGYLNKCKMGKLQLAPAQIIELSTQCINLDCYNQAKL